LKWLETGRTLLFGFTLEKLDFFTPAGITKFEMRQRQSKRGANGAA
jgi:hypothetical protein